MNGPGRPRPTLASAALAKQNDASCPVLPPNHLSRGVAMKSRLLVPLTLLSLCGMFGIACARAHGVAFTDPAKAGPDFQVQGEYVGELKVGDKTEKIGLQVVALGKGEFEATAFHGGLPGDGWSRGDKTAKCKGKT